MPKRSTISPLNPDWRPTLFLDATYSAQDLADILIAAKWSVELHKIHFSDQGNIPDHEWIRAIAPRGWVIITSDRHMRSWRAEDGLVRPTIETTKAKIFFLGGARTLEEYAHAIGLAGTAICRIYKRHQGTFVFSRIHSGGSRIGEVQLLSDAGGTATQKKFGATKHS